MDWPLETRRTVLAAARAGHSHRDLSRQHGVPRGTISYWAMIDRRRRGEKVPERPNHCPLCTSENLAQEEYAYLLGLYLGDGYIVSKEKQHHLSIDCSDTWPGLMDATEAAMRTVLPEYNTSRVQRQGCVEVKSYGTHWTCLFPQHGPGPKHLRRIILSDWQHAAVEAHPWELIRGLIHSDGCRLTNWTVRTVAGLSRRYEYPRYFFTNKSLDILRIMGESLDRVSVEWKVTRRAGVPYNISVARRTSVALMDHHGGAKF
jgi:hypothetical protein